MKLRLWILIAALAALRFGVCPPDTGAEEFAYQHHAGDKYRILSTVREDVYTNYKFSHHAEILNRIAVEVTASVDGKGSHKAVFQTSERAIESGTRASSAQRANFQWAKEYESEFDRDRTGKITIDKQYFMPVVRNVPVFPGRNLKPGEKWSADGHEMHDFRDSFGIAEPYRIPFTAEYVFLGERQWKDKSYPAFSVNYRILAEMPPVNGRLWPRRISGASEQTVFWDNKLGQPAAYEEQFRMVFELSDGTVIEYRGSAEAEIVESVRMEKEKIAEEISADLNRLAIPDVTVRVVDEGITLSLDAIQFQAESARLLPGETSKLDKIAEILRRYQERDIMVSGHTARSGTPESQKKLSEQRAAAVANYLISQKARTPDRIVVRGYGGERPVADNVTDEGRQKNRRVEITILEN